MAAFLIIPVFVAVYMLFAPVSVKKRILQMVISAISVVVSAGWWVAIVQLVPAANRPYIGSSQKNSILDLIFGYNGLGRLTGNESGMGGQGASMGTPPSGMASQAAANIGGTGSSVGSQAANMGGPGGGGGMGANFSGSTGLSRLFNSEMGGQISWLIPAALILLVAAVWLVRRNWKSDRAVPALALWAGTFFITGIVFSFSQGTIHPYYTVALAPAIGAIIGIGVEVLWNQREQLAARLGLAAAIALTVVWSFVLLDRTPSWNTWLRFAILIIGVVAAIAIVVGSKLGRSLMLSAAAAGLAASLAGPFAFTVQTIATPHTGSMPSAGPATNGDGFPGNRNGAPGNFGGGQMPPGNNSTAGQTGNSGFGGFNGNNTGNSDTGNSSGNNSGNFKPGGFGGDSTPSTAIVNLLKQDASKYTWVAATVGSQSSAPYQLATDEPIMDIGGFNGSDSTPTLSQFKKYVSEGKIHYYISGGMNHGGGFNPISSNTASSNTTNSNTNELTNGNTPGGNFQNGPMSRGSNSEIINWVQNHFKSKTVDGVTLYDLTQTK
jgi:4-amino-4-deoxy-L-arabinose transferase-like glycosyltransferase